MNRDAMVSAIILIAGSIGIGLWYWKLSPDDKLRRLGRSGGAGPAGAGPAPVGPPADLPNFTPDPAAPPDPGLIIPNGKTVPLGGGHLFTVGRN